MYKKARILKNIREAVAQGSGVYKACGVAGISPVTLWLWRKKDRRVEMYVQSLMEHRVQLVEDALYANAIKGNTTAQIFFLKNRGKGWSDGPLVDQRKYVQIFRPEPYSKDSVESASRRTDRSV